MEMMLRYLNHGQRYTDKQNEDLANYLTGRAELEQVKPFLRKKYGRFYDKEVQTMHQEIGQGIQQNPGLLPRLGRFLHIIRSIYTSEDYSYLIAELAKGWLSLHSVYADSGFGIHFLIMDLLDSIDRTSYITPYLFGKEGYPEIFSELYTEFPEGFERLTATDVDINYAVFACVWLYGQDPVKYKDLREKILSFGALLINSAVRSLLINTVKKLGFSSERDFVAEGFRSVRAEPVFAQNPYISQLQNQTEKESGDWKKVTKNTRLIFALACVLSPARLAELDLITYMLLYASCGSSFSYFKRIKAFLLPKKDADLDIFHDFLSGFHQGLYPKACFLSYYANIDAQNPDAGFYLGGFIFDHNLKAIKEPFYKVVRAYEEDALKAAAMSDRMGSVFLMSAFWEEGLHREQIPQYEKKLLQKFLRRTGLLKTLLENPAEKEAVFNAFYGKTTGFPEIVNNLDFSKMDGYLALFAAFLSPVSRIPDRIVNCALSQQKASQMKRVFQHIESLYGEQACAQFIDALTVPVHETIVAFTDFYTDSYLDEEKMWWQKKIRCCVMNGPEPMEAAFKMVSAEGRVCLLETIYKEMPDSSLPMLIDALSDSSKRVRDLAVAYLTPRQELKEQIEPLTLGKKKALRESAEKLMMAYNAAGNQENSSGEGTGFNALAYCLRSVPAVAAKSLAWTEFDALPKVRLAAAADESGPDVYADDRIVQGYIYLMVTQKEMVLPPPAVRIRETLHRGDLGTLGRQLYHIWKRNGAPAKQRAVLALAAIDSDETFISELKGDIQRWAEASRGALAAEAVRAMALQGSNLALMTVDAISKKFNNKQVKRVAGEAFQFAAEQLGVDPEVLGDRIVPTLGFDSRGEQVIDYGNRCFTATITPDLQIALRNADGKGIKSLPAVGAHDDQEKAAAAKTAFSAMKKNLKSVVSMQCLRLELALSCNRTWSTGEWHKLFVENPIMHMFAIGLIWGTYDDAGNLLDSFRYMEDGTFTAVDEEDFTLEENDRISLCHPLDLGHELIAQWTQQLMDYEIKQPLEQLARKMYPLPDNAESAYTVTQVGGAVVYAVSLWSKLQKMGWSRGSVQDAGVYYSYYKEDKKQNIGVWLNFSGTYIGADAVEEVTLYEAVFYQAGTVAYGSYIYDEVAEGDRFPLSRIPARLYSETCYDLERAAANRIRTDEKWQIRKGNPYA